MTVETIMVVEDEGLIALHLTEMLEKSGYRITGTCASGERALKAIEQFPCPDLILMDIGLAGAIDGIETARRIKQRFSVPIIFVTAYTSDTTLELMQEISPEGVIFKPFLDTDLLGIIRKAIKSHAN
jgi:two-component system, response regulator PdtaR